VFVQVLSVSFEASPLPTPLQALLRNNKDFLHDFNPAAPQVLCLNFTFYEDGGHSIAPKITSANAASASSQAPVRNRQTRKVANAKGLNRNTDLA